MRLKRQKDAFVTQLVSCADFKRNLPNFFKLKKKKIF